MNPINYLKKFIIESFQSHIKTTIEPAPPGQLTVITGPSDGGKTAILRALRWLFVNEPDGDSFIRVGATFARVTAEYEGVDGNSSVVVRHRTSGGTNRYIVNNEKLEGFGRGGVPLEVKDITGVQPVKIGDMEFNLNIAEQLSGPFLGSSVSAPARAKVLGKLAGTEEIDYANKILGTDLYRRNQDEKRLGEDFKKLEEQVAEYDYLPEMSRKIEALEGLAERVKVNQERRSKLARLTEQANLFNEKIVKDQAVLYRWRHLEDAENILAGVIENQRNKETLIKLANNFRTYHKSIWACKEVIAKYSTLPEAESLLQKAQNANQRARQLRNLRTSYNAGSEMIQRSQDILSRLESLNIAEATLETTTAKKRLREKLKSLEARYIVANCAVVGSEELLAKFAGVDEAGEKMAQATEKQLRWKQLKALKGKYTLRLDAIEAARLIAIERENRVAELEGVYVDELDSLGVCPMCGALKNEMRIKEVV